MKKTIKTSTKSIIGSSVETHTQWDKKGSHKKQKLETSSQEYDGYERQHKKKIPTQAYNF